MSNSARIHPLVLQAQEKLAAGRIDRREFLRYATLLGTSLTAATVLAACGQPVAAPAAAPMSLEGQSRTLPEKDRALELAREAA